MSVNGSLMLLNLLTTGMEPPWFLFCAIPWGMGLASQYGKLWSSGYSWRDVIDRPPAPDAIESPKRKKVGGGGAPARLPNPIGAGDEFGQYAAQVKQMQSDRQAIVQLVGKLPESEKKLLPEIVPTVESLLNRGVELAGTLHQMEGEVDRDALDRLEERIVLAEAEGEGKERDRRLDLMRRQKQTLSELLDRRGKVEAQFDSCVLAVQNMRFDLLRLRSAGVAAVLDNITMVTQQAKALNRDVNAAIAAAGEIRETLRAETPRP